MNESNRCLYNNSFSGFLSDQESTILGRLFENYHGDTRTTTRDAWEGEISIMQDVLSRFDDKNGQIILE